jgi:hypothetical protein
MKINGKDYTATHIYDSQEGLLAAVREKPLASFGECVEALYNTKKNERETLRTLLFDREVHLVTGTTIAITEHDGTYFYEREPKKEEHLQEVIENIEQSSDGLVRRLNFLVNMRINEEHYARLVTQALCGSVEGEEMFEKLAQETTSAGYKLLISADVPTKNNYEPQRAVLRVLRYQGGETTLLGAKFALGKCFALTKENA